MTNEQLAALLYQLACRMKTELDFVKSELTAKQKDNDITGQLDNMVLELKQQIEMLTGDPCPMV